MLMLLHYRQHVVTPAMFLFWSLSDDGTIGLFSKIQPRKRERPNKYGKPA